MEETKELLQSQRNRALMKIKQCLSTEGGSALLEELEEVWEPDTLMGDNPQDTAYNVGLRDAFKFMKQLQNGEFIHE